MKYFTYELWKDINNNNKNIQEQANKEWNDNIELYNDSFKKTKKHISNRFLRIFNKNQEFHDWDLIEININHSNRRKSYPINIEITIENEKKYCIQYNTIKDFKIKNNNTDLVDGFDVWGYSEFFIIDNTTLSHEIIFSSGMAILIYFENIKINELK